jgi:hypothetical protein
MAASHPEIFRPSTVDESKPLKLIDNHLLPNHAVLQWRPAKDGDVTPCVTKILIKLLKMQLSLKAREDQAIKVSNQNLNYQDFKFEVPKCYLVWTDILSHQIFRIYRSRIRPCS